MRLKNTGLGALTGTLAGLFVLAVVAFTAVPAFALNPERHYELVSPVYKAGYGVGDIKAVAPDGESVAFQSSGVYNGSLSYSAYEAYMARRGADGWVTSPLDPPASVTPASSVNDFSANLELVLAIGSLGPNAGVSEKADGAEERGFVYNASTPDVPSNWENFGPVLTSLAGNELEAGKLLEATEEGASSDLCHIIILDNSDPLLEQAIGTNEIFYELSRGCDGEPAALRLVALNDTGQVIDPNCLAGFGGPFQENEFNAISADGRQVFFTSGVGNPTCRTGAAGYGAAGYASVQVFVRLNAQRTVEVSKPLLLSGGRESCQEVPCPGAKERPPAFFKGASEDGSRVFFSTTTQLTGGDTNGGNELYMAMIGCPVGEPGCAVADRQVTSLVQVSSGAIAGEAAEVQGVVRVAPDGARVYFVARGALSGGSNAEGHAPVKGADNLYVSEGNQGQAPVFVADLCSGPRLSGSAEDARCPSDLNTEAHHEGNDVSLWLPETEDEAQSTADGGFLVFSSFGQLVSSDTDNAKDVYRYDASSGALERVSVGEGGADANGNRDDKESEQPGFADATIQPALTGKRYFQLELNGRAISEDGSRTVFSSAEPLSPAAVNGLSNIYEWHKEPGWTEGRVSLISSGTAPTRDRYPVISPSGRDVFFETTAGLVSQDTDGVSDIYDARLGSGFPVPAALPQECSGDACQGPLTNPAPLLVPGSVSQAPGGNLAPPVPVVVKSKSKSKPAKCKRDYVKRKGRCVKKPKPKKITGKRRG